MVDGVLGFYRWDILCQRDAEAGLRHDAGSAPGCIWGANGWTPLSPRPLRGSLLGSGDPSCPRGNPRRHRGHGAQYERHRLGLYRHFLHALWRALQRRLHGRHPTLLHLHRTRKSDIDGIYSRI